MDTHERNLWTLASAAVVATLVLSGCDGPFNAISGLAIQLGVIFFFSLPSLLFPRPKRRDRAGSVLGPCGTGAGSDSGDGDGGDSGDSGDGGGGDGGCGGGCGGD